MVDEMSMSISQKSRSLSPRASVVRVLFPIDQIWYSIKNIRLAPAHIKIVVCRCHAIAMANRERNVLYQTNEMVFRIKGVTSFSWIASCYVEFLAVGG